MEEVVVRDAAEVLVDRDRLAVAMRMPMVVDRHLEEEVVVVAAAVAVLDEDVEAVDVVVDVVEGAEWNEPMQ